MRISAFLVLVSILITCSTKPTQLKTGVWRGVVEMQGLQLPFGLEIYKNDNTYTAAVVNAGEKILLDEVSVTGDSVRIGMHIFDSELRAKIEDGKLEGSFVKNYDLSATLPFTATFGDTYRFIKTETNVAVDFSGKYALVFDTEKKPYRSVGILTQTGNEVEGTFLTPTGDYRYLQGNVVGNELLLSTFDGNHTFVFKAHFEGDSLKGNFYSGKISLESFKGVRDENAVMPDAEKLTFLKEGYHTLDFSFPDPSGNKISLSDERFKNKVVILQIFGTWCPNCMDETKFLSPWYDANKHRGIEVLGLAYERKPDFDYASKRISIMKEKLQVNYDFVIAGVNDKEKAAETLPALNHVLSFPTTIFIGKDGAVKHIHTGFTGPGTGIYYDQFKDRFNQIVNELLSEDLALSKQ
ncbi:MAG: TlpA family protein disulfide reductase [Cyclobacteriaceae bacterium]|nr:TlpA family protein disulfide reductase [Cyclobacteriaceae bacterium]